jgi:hypothetical protein
MSSSVIFTFLTVPSCLTQATCWPFLIVPLKTRRRARRPRKGDASRLVTCACRGCLEQRLEVVVVGQLAVVGLVVARGAVAAGRVDDGHVEDRVEVEVRVLVRHVGREAEEQVLALGHDLVDARVGAVGLVDQEDHGELRLERLAEHEARLGQRALGRVDEEHDAVDHGQAALDLAAEVGVTRGVDHVDDDGRAVGVLAVVEHRGVLREDRDALLALEVVRVHHAVLALEVGVERVRLLEHGVDQGGLAVVHVGHDGHIAEVVARD